MKAKIIGVAGALTPLLFVAGAHAQTPAYTMDSSVQTSISGLLSSFVAGAFVIIGVAIGLVGGYYVTVRLVHVLLRWFNRFGH